ncbi:FAD-dependent oxidoreductase [Streptomyces javensis]
MATAPKPTAPARVYDVIVVGSGGAGLVAACAAADRGASVAVLERAPLIGGTTAISGGHLWIPCHPHLGALGLTDTREDALHYLDRITLGSTAGPVIEAFVDNGPRLVTYLERDLGIPLFAVRRPDYHPDFPGAAEARTLEPLPLDASALGPGLPGVRTSPTRPPLTSAEGRTGVPAGLAEERRAKGILTQGAALVAGLVLAAARRGVDLCTGQRMGELIEEDGAVRGVVVHTAEGERVALRSRRAVVLASGGFEWNPALRSDFLPRVPALPVSPPGNEGDGLRLAMRAGARIAGMSEAWWTAAIAVPGQTYDDRPMTRNAVRELAFPGSILVNAAGHRFADEASSYNDLGKAFLAFDQQRHTFPNARAWLITDSAFRRQYPIAGLAPGTPTPSWIPTHSDLGGLAALAGIDPLNLTATVSTFNTHARNGVDPQFERGHNPHDRYNGDGGHQPNPCLGPITTPPFHAVPVTLGINGTKGGVVTDHLGRVLGSSGNPLPGLLACGNVAQSLMGPGYAGSGASLGPALTAAMTVGGEAARQLPAPRT